MRDEQLPHKLRRLSWNITLCSFLGLSILSCLCSINAKLRIIFNITWVYQKRGEIDIAVYTQCGPTRWKHGRTLSRYSWKWRGYRRIHISSISFVSIEPLAYLHLIFISISLRVDVNLVNDYPHAQVSLSYDSTQTGTCYAASNYPPCKTKSTTYCPGYINRRKGNKDGKLPGRFLFLTSPYSDGICSTLSKFS